jgi:2-dehydropantoate 2-reductase
MRICIFGAGAIGGLLGARLAVSGADVSLVARGPHLAAMRERGLELRTEAGSILTRPAVTDDAASLGHQDYLIVTLKAHSVPSALPAMAPLIGPNTAVVMGVNGVPWWYFYGLEGPWRDRRIASVDPGDRQWRQIGPQRVIACVVYPAAEIESPGVVRLVEGDRFSLGEPDGSRSERVSKLAAALVSAGFRAPVRPKIRDEIWVKLWGNLSFNPISALTSATLDKIVDHPETRAVARAMMVEAQAIAEKLGVQFAIDVDKRIDGARAVGAHKTSMLQDLERGRPMEISALVDAVRELGEITGVPTPTIDVVAGLVRLRAEVAGCLPVLE